MEHYRFVHVRMSTHVGGKVRLWRAFFCLNVWEGFFSRVCQNIGEFVTHCWVWHWRGITKWRWGHRGSLHLTIQDTFSAFAYLLCVSQHNRVNEVSVWMKFPEIHEYFQYIKTNFYIFYFRKCRWGMPQLNSTQLSEHFCSTTVAHLQVRMDISLRSHCS